jgi:hypothetical protein
MDSESGVSGMVGNLQESAGQGEMGVERKEVGGKG